MEETELIYTLVAFAIAFLALVGAALWWYFKVKLYQIEQPVEAEGEIMEWVTLERPKFGLQALFSKGESVRHHPVVRFRIDGARLVRFRNRKGYASQSAFEVGQKVRIAYSKNNPLVAKVLDPTN